MKLKNYLRSDTLTLVLINLAFIMEVADESLLPGVYKEVGKNPAYRPLLHRANVIALGAFLWSAATFLVAISYLTEIAISRGLNGIGLAISAPAILSLVADSTDDSNRGTAFGWIMLFSDKHWFSYIPLAAILLLLLPNDPSTALLHGLVLFILGFSASWSGPATNSPIFAEIVPERAQQHLCSDRSFETILASFAPTLLAMYTAIGIPMVICCSIYSLLYCTYPRDRDRARLQQIDETANFPSEEQQPY
ncbi:hypothetical protein HAX54_046914 [Datura stramonium]|uniref:Uncharacterized protein n=1 Tax=Datura stramonium TaxID=4076 RepID=A0ABS8SRU1_DATST|nr:hypothetical protein [Datura stramonium]